MSGCIGEVAWSVGTQGQKGYRWYQGHWGVPRGVGVVRVISGVVGGVRGVLGRWQGV